MISTFTHFGTSLGPWLYVIVTVLVFGESALLLGMLLPGETALLVGGYFAHQGAIDLWVLIPLAVVAAIAGDAVGFEIGRHYGPALRASRIGRLIGPTRWANVDGFLSRHGGKAVLLARFTAVLRALTPTMAGMSRIRYATFLRWNTVGGAIWGAGCVLLGWGFASALTQVGHYLTWAPMAMAALAGVVALWLHRRHQNGSSVDELNTPADPSPAAYPAVPASPP